MVSRALLDLFSHYDAGKAIARTEYPQTWEDPQRHTAEVPPPVDGLISEVERLGCQIDLVAGQPVLKGNSAALTPSLLAMLKENRSAIIARLSERAAPTKTLSFSITPEHSGIRKDAATGKLHLFGNPSPAWLREQGWEWDKRRRRFMAPFPFDRADPRPCDMIGGGPSLPADHPEIIFEPQNEEAA